MCGYLLPAILVSIAPDFGTIPLELQVKVKSSLGNKKCHLNKNQAPGCRKWSGRKQTCSTWCFFLSQCICIHLKSNTDKFYLLCLMTRKLFALARGECMEDNPDSLVNQEVLTPGQLFLMFLKVSACCCS